jgi:hypothetical protein
MLLVDHQVFSVLCNDIKRYFPMQRDQSNFLHHLERCSIIIICMILLFSNKNADAQHVRFSKQNLQPVHTSMEINKVKGNSVVTVIKDAAIKADDENTFVKIKGLNFTNGTIKVNVLSKLTKNAPAHARGFIGIAFRINKDNSKFESIYIRPTNGRANDQLRRNRSIQYFSYPDYRFERLRKESAGLYEAYTDMGLNEWIALKIVVHGDKAQLFINGAKYPSLVVNDLKHGADGTGGIGLFVDIGTEGYFSNLEIISN